MPPTRLIHIDIDPAEIGRNYPAEIGAVADLKQALAALVRAAKLHVPGGMQRPKLASEISTVRSAFVAGNLEHAQSDAFPMRPERILADVRAVLPRDALITTDVGWNKNGVGQQFPILEPGTIFTPGGLATMGFGAPAALGAKLASPKRSVVALVGDGGFGQNPALLATAFEQDIAVVWVIMNNFAFGTIAGLEKAHFGTTFGTVFEKDGKPYSPDYAAIAKAYGIDGLKVTRAAEFRPALERALKSGKPFVLDVAMQNEPVPTGRPLEHHGHLLARPEGAPREHGGRRRWVSLREARVLPRAPDRAARAAAGAGGDRVAHGLPVREHPHHARHAGRAALRPGARPEPDARDAPAAGGHRHRGARHRALPLDPRLEPADFAPELEAAARLGARRIIAQLPDPNRDRKIDRFGRLCDMAKPYGISVELEFPHWTETGNLSEAVQVLRGADRPNAGILIDMLHMGRSGSSTDELRNLPREWFQFAHVCDAELEVPPTMERILRTARHERLFPGEGSIDVRGILSCLPEAIPYSLEIPRTTLTKAVGPEEVARLALRVARSHLDERNGTRPRRCPRHGRAFKMERQIAPTAQENPDEGARAARRQPQHVRQARSEAVRDDHARRDQPEAGRAGPGAGRRGDHLPDQLGRRDVRAHPRRTGRGRGRGPHQRRGLDALQLRDPRRALDPHGADRGGPHVEHPCAGAFPPCVGGRRDRQGADRRVRRGQLPAGAARRGRGRLRGQDGGLSRALAAPQHRFALELATSPSYTGDSLIHRRRRCRTARSSPAPPPCASPRRPRPTARASSRRPPRSSPRAASRAPAWTPSPPAPAPRGR
jgi:sugar phosphate isomerase/epimerase